MSYTAQALLDLVDAEIASRLGAGTIMRSNVGSSGFEKESLASLYRIRESLKAEVNAGKSTTNYAIFEDPD